MTRALLSFATSMLSNNQSFFELSGLYTAILGNLDSCPRQTAISQKRMTTTGLYSLRKEGLNPERLLLLAGGQKHAATVYLNGA